MDAPAYLNLEHPSPITFTNKDVISDPELNARVRRLLFLAIKSSEAGNTIRTRMEDFYRTNKYDTAESLTAYAAFLQKNYPDAEAAVIKPGLKFNALKRDQMIYFGLFMAERKELSF